MKKKKEKIRVINKQYPPKTVEHRVVVSRPENLRAETHINQNFRKVTSLMAQDQRQNKFKIKQSESKFISEADLGD